MKKILFAAYSLDIGGIETSLVTLLNCLSKEDYNITLVLEKRQGIFLDSINTKINIIEYEASKNKNIILRKIINFINRIKFISKYKNKFDVSISYATYSLVCSFVARKASKNSILWGHADYLRLFENNKKNCMQFFKNLNYEKFKKIVFVSEEGKKSFLNVFPKMKEKVENCNNLVNYKEIIDKSEEKISLPQKQNEIFFANIGRHDEKQKKLSRLIEASKMLKDENLNFKVLFIGDGPDTKKYKEMVKEYKLENYILFLGRKKNPYPYMKFSDCIILTSEYEGYPVVFLESKVLNVPIITTEVSDYKQIEEGYGIITKKEPKDIYMKMKRFIIEGYKIENRFNAENYNIDILNKIKKIIEY